MKHASLLVLFLGVSLSAQAVYNSSTRIEYDVHSVEETQATFTPVVDGVDYEPQTSACVGFVCKVSVSQSLLDYINAHASFTLSGKLTLNGESSPTSTPATIVNGCFYRPRGSTIPLAYKDIDSVIEDWSAVPYGPRISELENWGWAVRATWSDIRNKLYVIAICKGQKVRS